MVTAMESARGSSRTTRARGKNACALFGSHARERFHQVFRRDDAGRRHFERGGRFDVRLARAHGGAVHEAQAFDAVRAAVFGQMFERGFLLRCRAPPRACRNFGAARYARRRIRAASGCPRRTTAP